MPSEKHELETILFGSPEAVEDLRRAYFRRVMLLTYPLGFLAVLLALALDLRLHGRVVSPVDAALLPLLGLGFLVGFFLLLWDERYTLAVGQGLFWIFALYVLLSFVYQHFFFFPQSGRFSEVSYWAPLLYLGAFLLFPLKHAWRIGLLLWGLGVLTSLVYLLVEASPISNIWLQYHAAGLATLGVGFLIALSSSWYSTARSEATVDYLTRLPNRRYTQFVLERMIREAERAGRPLSVILLDLDNFKRINDTLGHWAGDRVLRSLAQAIRGMLREHDWLGRWGGEEFLILLPSTDGKRAAQIAERLGQRLKALRPEGLRVSASLGVAELRAGESPVALIARADRAMYRAKAAGKGRVEVDA